MAEGVMALFCMGFLAGAIAAIFIACVVSLIKK